MDINLTIREVHIHHHGATSDQLAAITKALKGIKELIMITAAEFTAAFAEVDQSTTQIAALIQTLIDERKAGGMTDTEEAAQLAKLGQIRDVLRAMAATPTNPVPLAVPA